ncbi:MAG: PIN domain-containing protein [Burkholderiaceae bacterium]
MSEFRATHVMCSRAPQPVQGRVASLPLAVLDTNVWLDWLVFDDPATRWLDDRAGHEFGLIASDAMRAELAAVLAREKLGLATGRQNHLLMRFDALVQAREIEAAPPRPWLPCTDPDDQKFLDLARSADVRWLVSRDKALLRVARRARAHGLRILRPGEWPGDPR